MNNCFICDYKIDDCESNTIDMMTFDGEHETQEVYDVCVEDINSECDKIKLSDAFKFKG